MPITRRCAPIALIMLLAGCGANTVPAAEVALTQAEVAAKVYTDLPRCPAAAPCSDPAIVAKIGTADNLAYAAVKAAEAGTGDPAAASSAIAALIAAIPVK